MDVTLEEKVVISLKITACVLALVLISSAIYMVTIGKDVDDALFRYDAFIIPEEYVNTARASIILGVSLALVIGVQLFGVVREWALFMFLNVCILTYLGIIGFLIIKCAKEDREKLHPQLYVGLLVALKRFGDESDIGGDFRRGWTSIQHDLNCCGVHNYTEWKDIKMRYRHDPQIPISCCINPMAFCTDNVDFDNSTQASEFIFVKGCFEKAKLDIPIHRIWDGMIGFEVLALLTILNCAFLAWKWRRLNTW